MTATKRRVDDIIECRADEALRASRRVFALIAALLAAAFLFCHGCHSGDHDDELAVHWLDHDH